MPLAQKDPPLRITCPCPLQAPLEDCVSTWLSWLSAAKVRPRSRESRSSEPEAPRPGDCCWDGGGSGGRCDFSHQLLLAQQRRLPSSLHHGRSSWLWIGLSGRGMPRKMPCQFQNALHGKTAPSGLGRPCPPYMSARLLLLMLLLHELHFIIRLR